MRGMPNTYVCRQCELELPEVSFYTRTQRNGKHDRHVRCRHCENTNQAKRRQTSDGKAKYQAYYKAWRAVRHADPVYRTKRRAKLRVYHRASKMLTAALINAFHASGCAICREMERCCLSAHHLDPSSKDFQIGGIAGKKGPKTVAAELSKCVCLCENCHRKVHAGILTIQNGPIV